MFKLLKFNNSRLSKAIIVVIILVFTFNIFAQEAVAAWRFKDLMAFNNRPENSQDIPLQPKVIRVVLTGYSSTPDQTDDTPFTTASNTRVRDGVVAANFLAFGTKVQIPSLFGDKVFTVEDRMAKKHNDKIDIWFPEKQLAKNFGVHEADVVVLE